MTENPAAQANAPPKESRVSNGTSGKMNTSPSESVATRDSPRTSSSKPDNSSGGHASAKKRRKVNHGKLLPSHLPPPFRIFLPIYKTELDMRFHRMGVRSHLFFYSNLLAFLSALFLPFLPSLLFSFFFLSPLTRIPTSFLFPSPLFHLPCCMILY